MSIHPIADVGVQQLVPLLMVQNMERSLDFYVTGLGFEIENAWEPEAEGRLRWCRLGHGRAALMLQEWGAADPRRTKLPGKVGAGVGLYFQCTDAIAFYKSVKERGIGVERPFVGNNMWVASLDDPDGYSLHFESPTDAPEESEYREEQQPRRGT